MVNDIIETINLSKKYKLKGRKKEIIAINDINISIKEGEIFGLLGPNGAGKTTLVHILTTLNPPTTGTAIIDGYDILKKPKKAKAKVTLMLDSKILYPYLTGYANLNFFCKIYDIPNYKQKIYDIAKEFGLEDWLNQYVSKYSLGMKMKLSLCRTLLPNRKILFLDEPTLGLDVETKAYIVNKLKNIDGTIFLTSHDMGIVDKLCDRIAFINNGKIVKIGTRKDLQKFEQSEVKIIVKISKNRNQLYKELNQQEFIKEIINLKNGFNISLVDRGYYQDLLLILSKYKILMIKEQDQQLEDLFLDIIKEG